MAQDVHLKLIVPTCTTLLLGSKATTLPLERTLTHRDPGSQSHPMDQIRRPPGQSWSRCVGLVP